MYTQKAAKYLRKALDGLRIAQEHNEDPSEGIDNAIYFVLRALNNLPGLNQWQPSPRPNTTSEDDGSDENEDL